MTKKCSIWKHEWTFGRTRNAVRTQAAGKCFHSFFEFSPTFTSGYSIETRRTCFLFFLEYTRTKKRKTTSLLWSSNCKFSLLAPSLRQQLELVLCLHRVLVTRFLTNQRAYFFKIHHSITPYHTIPYDTTPHHTLYNMLSWEFKLACGEDCPKNRKIRAKGDSRIYGRWRLQVMGSWCRGFLSILGHEFKLVLIRLYPLWTFCRWRNFHKI